MRHYHLTGGGIGWRLLGLLSMVVIAIVLVFGGATRLGEGEVANAIARLTSLTLLVFATLRLQTQAGFRPEWKWPLALLAATMSLPLLQLVPLPPAIWPHLPGRGEVAEIFRTAGIPIPWLPVGLNPEGSLNGFLALLPGAALFVAGLMLGTRARFGMVAVVLVAALASTVLGIAQVAEGPDSTLRFYATTNASAAVGFFSNRNHQAALQLAAIPLVSVLLLAWSRARPGRGVIALAAGGTLIALLTGAILQSESRAGLVLYLPVVAASALMLMRSRLPPWPLPAVVGAGVTLAVAAGLGGALLLWMNPDLTAALGADARIRALPVATSEAVRHLPFGSGLGTFDDIYRARESAETLSNAYLNHAHNDYLEILLETGLAGGALIVLFLIWYGRRVVDAWRGAGPSSDLACAATILVATLALHSLVDYPLRTGALSGLFGFACALLLFNAEQDQSAASSGERESIRERPDARLPRGVRSRRWK